MIESGSLTPGISAADFRLPAHTAMRYERPAPELTELFSNYHVFDSEGPRAANAVNWLLPGWPAIRIILADHPIALTIGSRSYDPMPVAALYGTTSRAMRMTSSGGVTVGIDLTPLGWSRLFRAPADKYRDRVEPLSTLMPPDLVAELVAELRADFDDGRGAKAVLDRFLLRHIAPPDPAERDIRALMGLIADDETRDLASAAAAIGIDPARLRRLSNRYFGFPPKTLLLRTRFLRSFLRMKRKGNAVDYSQISPAYHDASHFLRDANRFLGMTPRRFLAMRTDYLDSALRAYALVMRRAKAEAQRPTEV